MKIYVDELPKSCVNCDFGYANNFCELDYDLDLREFDKNQKHTKCPLQSLADHDKQVRKEVCEKVLLIIDEKFNCCGYIEEKFDDIKRYVLDQIQGETNGNNN